MYFITAIYFWIAHIRSDFSLLLFCYSRKCDTIVKPVHYDVIETPSNAEENDPIIENGIHENLENGSPVTKGEVIQIQI